MAGLSCSFTIYDRRNIPVTAFDSTLRCPADVADPGAGPGDDLRGRGAAPAPGALLAQRALFTGPISRTMSRRRSSSRSNPDRCGGAPGPPIPATAASAWPIVGGALCDLELFGGSRPGKAAGQRHNDFPGRGAVPGRGDRQRLRAGLRRLGAAAGRRRSTDGSTAMARACAAAHPDRVRYLEHPGHANRGMQRSPTWGSPRRGASTWRCSTPTTSGSPTSSSDRSRSSTACPRRVWSSGDPCTGSAGRGVR